MTSPAQTKTAKRVTRKPKKSPSTARHRLKFPEVKGKEIETVEVRADGDDHSITLSFHDKTELRFDIEPGFAVATGYGDWKSGNWRTIKRWPAVRFLG
jgi:uncharacterized cupredoxin-like copper-binding protein